MGQRGLTSYEKHCRVHMGYWSEVMQMPRQRRVNAIRYSLRQGDITPSAARKLNELLDATEET